MHQYILCKSPITLKNYWYASFPKDFYQSERRQRYLKNYISKVNAYDWNRTLDWTRRENAAFIQNRLLPRGWSYSYRGVSGSGFSILRGRSSVLKTSKYTQWIEVGESQTKELYLNNEASLWPRGSTLETFHVWRECHETWSEFSGLKYVTHTWTTRKPTNIATTTYVDTLYGPLFEPRRCSSGRSVRRRTI